MNTGRGSFAKYISLISLLFSFTNFIPISAAISGLALVLYPFNFAANRTSRVVIPLVFLFVYSVISVVLYDASSLFNYDFYRRDGNFFITMTPLLFLASTVFFVDLDRTLKWFVYVSSFFNLAALSFWLVTGTGLLRGFFTGQGTTDIYTFLFVAHNAGGGFLMILCACTLAVFLNRRSMLNGAVLAVNVAGLILTNSRGSMVGLACAIILVFFVGRFRSRFYLIILTALGINLIVALYAYSKSDIEFILHRQAFVTNLLTTLTPGLAERLDSNVSNRIEVLWPLAMHGFFQSPIFGTGFGSFDDQPWRFAGWPGVFAWNAAEKTFHSDAHAHNTYFNVLAETGAIGLILLLWFLNRLFNFVFTLPPSLIRNALLLGFWAAVVSAFTEHRLFTPSQMLPFVILVGLTIAHHRFVTEEADSTRALKPAFAGLRER